MKFRFNPKKFHVRMGIWLSLTLSIFFIVLILKFGLPDSTSSITSCIKDSGKILRIEELPYIDVSPIKKKRTQEKALIITLKDKPYKIWLTDYSNNKYWKVINSKSNNGKIVDFYYVDRLLQDTVLYNPIRLDINGFEIIEFDLAKRKSIAGLILSLILLLISLFLLMTCILTYKEHLLRGDLNRLRKTGIKSKMKVIGDWMIN